jgi:hypothetical protein
VRHDDLAMLLDVIKTGSSMLPWHGMRVHHAARSSWVLHGSEGQLTGIAALAHIHPQPL